MSGLILLPGINMKSFAISNEQVQLTPANTNLIMDPSFRQISTEEAATSEAPVKNITFVAIEKNLTLPSGQQIVASTWNGTIPGPTVRVTQGDLLNINIINHPNNTMVHSLDHHAAIITASPAFGPINVSDSKQYSFIAMQPGFFKYHCEGGTAAGVPVLGMDQHVFQGMVGGVIVDPVDGYTGYETVGVENGTNALTTVDVSPEAKEVALQFSEYYVDPSGNYDVSAMYAHNPTASWINGIPFGYEPVVTKTPNATTLFFKQGDHVRFFLLNHGDLPVNFHIVGEQLDRVTDGSIVSGLGKQTYMVGGSNDAIADVVFEQPGVFAFVNHDYSQLFKGQIGLIVVDGPDNGTSTTLGLTDDANPSNAIPPTGTNSIPVTVKPYMLGSPLAWNGQNTTATS
jgi:nitrite reductase (NO-forming)